MPAPAETTGLSKEPVARTQLGDRALIVASSAAGFTVPGGKMKLDKPGVLRPDEAPDDPQHDQTAHHVASPRVQGESILTEVGHEETDRDALVEQTQEDVLRGDHLFRSTFSRVCKDLRLGASPQM